KVKLNYLKIEIKARMKMKMKKNIVWIIYVLFVILLFIVNSIEIVNWFNKSLFDHFEMDIEHVNQSFYNGVSLIFIITLFFYSLFGTALGSVFVTDLVCTGLIVANYYKVTERSEYLTYSELKTIIYPKEVLSFISIPMPVAIIIALVIFLVIYGFLRFIRKCQAKRNLLPNKKIRLSLCIISIALIIVIFIKPNNKIMHFETENTHNFNPVKQAQQDGFIAAFMDTVKPHYMQKPKGYKKKNMKKIYEKYMHAAQEINEDRTESVDESQTILYL